MPTERFPLIALAAVLCSACSPTKDPVPGDGGAARAAISDSLTGPGARDGTWQGADQRSTWHAILDGPRIAQLDEVAIFTDSARAMRQFQFDTTRALAKAREEREQLVYGATALPDTIRTLIELEWSNDSLVRSAKKVNGTDRLLQPYEVDNLREHAIELVRVARAGSAATSTPSKP